MIHYIELGINHILDPQGLDHLYFIVSFCLLYTISNLRKIAGLVTAFTLGHCITLALAALEKIYINPDLIELLIPITIIISCLLNYWILIKENKYQTPKGNLIYVIILFFGLIHGLGFSNFLSAMLFEGESIVAPLLGFNIGIEIAQLIIVIMVLAALWISDNVIKSKKIVRLTLNTIIMLMVLQMILF
ncbi:HupE/UreJ family protein [Winogradskyella sp. PG-2]|uniref:HupE/UreJ family protein n=1 Tax=Winogradskyella sp. PG-2 TaxID=754409 RepID=UPI00045872EA|nr:HupE/UreJ family protein [Winogradskyella sp. PG-2]BAO77032.1 membrane protein [Winogradskyella sp. PG-2]